jgi:hypothetical protein
MYLRRWLIVLVTVPIALTVLLSLPAAAEASVGVGVQAGPVRLGNAAHPGGDYALTPVYVVNTGTQAEFISVRVERLSPGSGRRVPSSWIHATGPRVQLSPRQAARIPLELTIPAGAKPGQYLSDVVVAGSTAVSVGMANLGVAAATKLEFSVAPGSAHGPWPFVPAWMWWTLGGLLLLALAAFGIRRSGLRIRVERRPPTVAPSIAARRTAWQRGSRVALVLAALTGLGACGVAAGSPPGAPGHSSSVSISLKVVPTVRGVAVSPSRASFGNCSGGNAGNNTASTPTALGFPNGRCWVGKPGANGSFPITITNTGIASYIDVNGAPAVPSDGGAQWSLCNLGSHPVVSCSSHGGNSPGTDQYLVQNFAGNGRQNSAGLTNTPSCDAEFGTAGGCRMEQGEAQQEGFELIGPMAPDDTSTSWTVTITWTPYPE